MDSARWFILAENGGNATAGQKGPPAEDVIIQAVEGLSAMGIGGWLAVEESHDGDKPTFREVRVLGYPRNPWGSAIDAMHKVKAGLPRGDLPIPPDVPTMRL